MFSRIWVWMYECEVCICSIFVAVRVSITLFNFPLCCLLCFNYLVTSFNLCPHINFYTLSCLIFSINLSPSTAEWRSHRFPRSTNHPGFGSRHLSAANHFLQIVNPSCSTLLLPNRGHHSSTFRLQRPSRWSYLILKLITMFQINF